MYPNTQIYSETSLSQICPRKLAHASSPSKFEACKPLQVSLWTFTCLCTRTCEAWLANRLSTSQVQVTPGFHLCMLRKHPKRFSGRALAPSVSNNQVSLQKDNGKVGPQEKIASVVSFGHIELGVAQTNWNLKPKTECESSKFQWAYVCAHSASNSQGPPQTPTTQSLLSNTCLVKKYF